MKTESNNEFVVLTEVVQKQYVLYLERQLRENVCAWAGQSRNRHKPTAWACIPESLQKLEAKAVKACMAAQVYQRVMVKTIAAVRRSTQEGRLANVLFDQMQNQSTAAGGDVMPAKSMEISVDKGTQTIWNDNQNGHDSNLEDDNCESYELRRKIDMFQARLQESAEVKEPICRRCRSKNVEKKKQPHPDQGSPFSETEDAVAQELAMLFGDEHTDLNEIFGIEPSAVNDDPQISAILEEIENAELPSPRKTEDPPSPASDRQQHSQELDLRQSRWPCELYVQRMRLNACMVRALEADWRCEDRLRYTFRELFGEDSDDEFATEISSPSIDLADEVLLASCVFRIRPWIVRHLMSPLEEGLIANRFLFKKLAKLLAHSIVMVNPYCSDVQIKQAVEHLFCLRPRGIQSAYDLDNLPPLDVDKFEV
ncbi:uncharacterized protein [Drosophila kikkawai]|uniref:Uncharacterized protein n=1 Tax=Drosophila kikkawai TaxID=30033 RepID=A0A6P4I488_DROKI|nr:uncharacterized protein LOC108072136 [Drosophila kikkawai]